MMNYITIALATASLIVNTTGFTRIKNLETTTSTHETMSIVSQNPSSIAVNKPVKQVVKKTYKMHVTAYTSRPEETDSTPFITASGSYVRDGIVATNFFPIGTLIRIPEHFGDKIFRVEDRMNERFEKNVDIWFSDLSEAKKFGKKFTVIDVL